MGKVEEAAIREKDAEKTAVVKMAVPVSFGLSEDIERPKLEKI